MLAHNVISKTKQTWGRNPKASQVESGVEDVVSQPIGRLKDASSCEGVEAGGTGGAVRRLDTNTRQSHVRMRGLRGLALIMWTGTATHASCSVRKGAVFLRRPDCEPRLVHNAAQVSQRRLWPNGQGGSQLVRKMGSRM